MRCNVLRCPLPAVLVPVKVLSISPAEQRWILSVDLTLRVAWRMQ